ncbi:MAG: hypothetical protein V3U27_21460 [Candidatus Tectomicrobia bacterium]
MKSECCHGHPDNGDLATQTPAQEEETNLRADIADLEAELAELKQIGNEHYNNQIAVLQTERDRYKALAERRGEALDMAIDTLALDEELPRPEGKMQAWVDKYGDVTEYEILVRLREARAALAAHDEMAVD